MSGLEVTAAIATITGSFLAATNIFQKWRDRKAARKTLRQHKNLDDSLRSGHRDVQKKYDEDFRQLGQAFAKGDGENNDESAFLIVTFSLTFT